MTESKLGNCLFLFKRKKSKTDFFTQPLKDFTQQ